MEARKLIIIGSGPAGYTAAVYAARAELKPLVLAGEKSGGQLMNTRLVENWPGKEAGIMGPDLMMEMRKQAQKFGGEIIDKNVTKVDLSQRPFKVWAGEEEYEAKGLIIATGAESIMLGVPGEKELMGRGVAICAVCDAPFYRDRVVYVIGGGDAAAEDALALTKYAKEVYLVHRRDELRASKIMVKRVKENSKIKILWNTELKAVIGKEKVEKIRNAYHTTLPSHPNRQSLHLILSHLGVKSNSAFIYSHRIIMLYPKGLKSLVFTIIHFHS